MSRSESPGGDNPSYVVKSYNAFSGGHCDPSHLALFTRTVDDVRALLLAQDVIYVGGGNTVNLLAVWRAQGVDVDPARGLGARGAARRPLRRLDVLVRGRRDGVLRAPPDDALATGSACCPAAIVPHYAARRDAYTARCAPGSRRASRADDGVALHFVDRRLAAVVASRPGRHAYRVGVVGGRVVEAPLEPVVVPGATPFRAATATAPDADGVQAALAAVADQPASRATSGGR